MHRLFSLAVLLLAGCASAQPPVRGATPAHKCRAEGANSFIGRTGNSETGAAILRATHAAVLRWAPPGAMLTMDYREDRVTVRLDSTYKITAIDCG